MNEETANAIYDLLVWCGGASQRARQDFIYHHTNEEHPATEWRFQGLFGFGGKFYSGESTRECPWRVGYHPEDARGDREPLYEGLRRAINMLLVHIWKEHNQ